MWVAFRLARFSCTVSPLLDWTRRGNAMTFANIFSPSKSLSLFRFLCLLYIPWDTYLRAKLPYSPLWLFCSRGDKCCKLNFCGGMSHSRICKKSILQMEPSVHPASHELRLWLCFWVCGFSYYHSY